MDRGSSDEQVIRGFESPPAYEGDWLSWLERHLDTVKVASSNLASPIGEY